MASDNYYSAVHDWRVLLDIVDEAGEGSWMRSKLEPARMCLRDVIDIAFGTTCCKYLSDWCGVACLKLSCCHKIS